MGSSSSTPDVTAASELGRLYLRANDVTRIINDYNRNINSPSVRSTSSSFTTLLSEISATSASYLINIYGIDLGSIVPTQSDAELISNLDTSLNRARLNGLLDRTYALEMHYQVRLLIVLENSISNKTDITQIKEFLDSSKESLGRLEETFGKYAQTD